ncbi:hypothetical protein G9A89_013804 [Geosiphon pyriformis]|nr:hypothetical protein G9A89_013804 [Geosiphon pyriformis]
MTSLVHILFKLSSPILLSSAILLSSSIATFSPYSISSNFTPRNMKLIVGLILLFATTNVAGQGYLMTPEIRIPKGDIENHLSQTRKASSDYKCGAATEIPRQITTHYTEGESIKIEFEIGKALEGNCFIDLSTTGKDTKFQTIGSVKDCGNKVDIFKTEITLPKEVTCEQCTLRFRWIPKLSGDTYINCADVSISPASPVSINEEKEDISLKKRQRTACYYGCGKKRSLIRTTPIPIETMPGSQFLFAKRRLLKRN